MIEDPGTDLHAPALCDVEFFAALHRALLAGSMQESRALEAIEDYLDLPLTSHGHRSLLPRIAGLRANFSAYDATYVALAERLGAALLSADRALVRAVRRHRLLDVAS